MSVESEQTTWLAHERDREWVAAPVSSDVHAFHRSLPGYVPTPLVELHSIAHELGVGKVFAKDETSRLGLPAFKALGASWAIRQALEHTAAADGTTFTLVTATDGNHGRAVARFARQLGHDSVIFLPSTVAPAAVDLIRAEGARVHVLQSSYDDTVRSAAEYAREDETRLLIQDTSWAGYEQVPHWIVQGYSTLFREIDEQLARLNVLMPDLTLVPTGVGSLLEAAVTHYRQDASQSTRVVAVEPVGAACIMSSLRRGDLESVPTGPTVLAGLNCGTPSVLAWPTIQAGVDGAIAIDDAPAVAAARDLGTVGVAAGPCGGAALAALRTVTQSAAPDAAEFLGLGEDSVVVLLVTEGLEANPLPEL